MIRNMLVRAACTSVVASALMFAGTAAAWAQSQPAPQPGQAAGQQARETSRGEIGLLWPLAGLAAIGGVIAAASGGGGGGNNTASVTSTAGTN